MTPSTAPLVHGDLRHLGYYTRILKKRLPREYFEPVPSRLLWFIPHLSVIIAGIASLIMFDLHWGIKLPISIVIGASMASLGFLGHEILHGAVVKTPWLRNFLGQICFWQFAISPMLWRRWHNVEHHGNTQHEHDDPDAMHTLEDLHERPALKLIYKIAPWLRAVLMLISFSFWFSMHSHKILISFLPDFSPRERAKVLLQYALPMAFWLGLLAWIGPAKWVWVYLLPLLIANFIVMSYIATNHLLNPLTPINDPLVNSLSVTAPRWVDVLNLNFSHHTEHHLFPAMNPKYAPRVKELCKELWPDRYNEMPHWKALLMVCLTPRVYYRYDQLIDPVRRLVYPVVGRGLEKGLAVKKLDKI